MPVDKECETASPAPRSTQPLFVQSVRVDAARGAKRRPQPLLPGACQNDAKGPVAHPPAATFCRTVRPTHKNAVLPPCSARSPRRTYGAVRELPCLRTKCRGVPRLVLCSAFSILRSSSTVVLPRRTHAECQASLRVGGHEVRHFARLAHVPGAHRISIIDSCAPLSYVGDSPLKPA